MKKLIVCLLAMLFTHSAKTQAIDIYHGINAGVASNTYLYQYVYSYNFNNTNRLPIAPALGYYLDIHMRGRTWLFTQFNLEWQHLKDNETNQNYVSTSTSNSTSNFVDLYIPIRFAFRLGKEDAKFTFFPTAGFGLYVPVFYSYNAEYPNKPSYNYRDNGWFTNDDGVPFYPLMNIGFEAKWKFSQKHNLAIGFNSDYLLAHNTVYLKFGWNRQYKHK